MYSLEQELALIFSFLNMLKAIVTIAMEHMNFDAHPDQYQKEIIAAYRNINKITTLTVADQQKYQSQLKTPVYVIPNMVTEKELLLQEKSYY